MKLAILFGVLAWLTWQVWRMPDVSSRLPRFLVVYAAFILLSAISLRFDGLGSIRYQQIFYAAAGIVAGCAIGLAAEFHGVHGRALGLLSGIAIVGFSFAIPSVIQQHVSSRPLPGIAGLHLAFAGIWISCGLIALLSCAANLPVFDLRVRALIGIAWLAHGVFMAALAVGMVRARAFWLGLNDWVPVTVALVCFGLLGLVIQARQSELGRAGQREASVEINRLQEAA